MKSPSLVATALACFAFAQSSLADTIHAIQGGGFYHHQSGWVFPETIGDFSLVGVPGDVNGTVDVEAYYARVSNGVRTVASVNVYPPDSATPETTPASIKGTPVSVEISKQPLLRAAKLAYKDGKSSRATVYFVDTGAWIVKIRASVPTADKVTGPILDKFVRSQRWDSLQLSTASCTGAACSQQHQSCSTSGWMRPPSRTTKTVYGCGKNESRPGEPRGTPGTNSPRM